MVILSQDSFTIIYAMVNVNISKKMDHSIKDNLLIIKHQAMESIKVVKDSNTKDIGKKASLMEKVNLYIVIIPTMKEKYYQVNAMEMEYFKKMVQDIKGHFLMIGFKEELK